MIKSKVAIVDDPDLDPGQLMAAAVTDAARRTEASNKALIEAVKGIIMKAPEVQIVHHETKQDMVITPERPTKWTFTFERDENNLLTRMTAEAQK